MPLSNIQSEVLRLLSSNRDPESYVSAPTYALSVDAFFRDRKERVAEIAQRDGALLGAHGYTLEWLRRDLIHMVIAARHDDRTRLEWVADSDFRFFPVVPDVEFGFVLNPVDLAINKISAAYRRRALRDLVDIPRIHERILSVGAAIWACIDESSGFTPEGVIAEIRRNSHYPRSEWEALESTEPIDPKVVVPRLRGILDEAEAFVLRMPTNKAGLLFIENGRVVQPDPDHLEHYQTHAGRRRGHWPSSVEIQSAMLERYLQ